MAKSVVIHCRMEVIDLDGEVFKRVGQEMLKNKGIWPLVPELPGLDLNEGRVYWIFEKGDRLRYDERLAFADWFATEAVKAIIDSGDSGKDEDRIPQCLLIRKEKETK